MTPTERLTSGPPPAQLAAQSPGAAAVSPALSNPRGAWLDWAMIPVAIEIAALGALAAYGAWHVFGRRPVDTTARLPFGLFFAPAIWLSWLLGAAIFTF